MEPNKTTEQMEEEIRGALVVMEPGALTVIEQANALVIANDDNLELSVSRENSLRDQVDEFDALFKNFEDNLKDRLENARAKKSEKIEPLESAIELIQEKRNTYITERQAKLDKEAADRQAEEDRLKAVVLAKHNKDIEKDLEKAGSIDEKVQVLQLKLGSPDTPEEMHQDLTNQIRALQNQRAGISDKVEKKAEKTVVVASIPPSAPASAPPKVKGLVIKQKTTVTVVDNNKLVKAIAEGWVPVTAINSFNLTKLKQFVADGYDLAKFGCSVVTENDSHSKRPNKR